MHQKKKEKQTKKIHHNEKEIIGLDLLQNI